MAKRYPANVKQVGTWSTSAPNPHVTLSTASNSFRTLSDAQGNGDIADSDTLDIYVYKDDSNWAVYENGSYDHSNGWIDLSAADAGDSAGTISNTDSVIITVDIGASDLEAIIAFVNSFNLAGANNGDVIINNSGTWEPTDTI